MALIGTMGGLNVGMACRVSLDSGEIALDAESLASSQDQPVVSAATSDADQPKE